MYEQHNCKASLYYFSTTLTTEHVSGEWAHFIWWIILLWEMIFWNTPYFILICWVTILWHIRGTMRDTYIRIHKNNMSIIHTSFPQLLDKFSGHHTQAKYIDLNKHTFTVHLCMPELMRMASYQAFSSQVNHLSTQTKFGQKNLLYIIHSWF